MSNASSFSFRKPEEVLPIGVPRLLLSESDFHDPDRNDGGKEMREVFCCRIKTWSL